MFVSEFARMFARRIRVFAIGLDKYQGGSDGIARQIIDDCFDKSKGFFMTSTGNFREFFCRDFGMCTDALVSLGYRKQVLSTLRYAIENFVRHGKVEQEISPCGAVFTFPAGEYSPDALAFLIRSLRSAGAYSIVKQYKPFLENEVRRYFKEAVDKKTGLVRNDRNYSSMKDYAIRKSSCYDNCITGMLSVELDKLGLFNPFKGYDYRKIVLKNFWNGEYFYEDLAKNKIVCGDANVLPFWTGLVTDKRILAKAISSIRKARLDDPFPLKYTNRKYNQQRFIPLEFFAGDYERDTIWLHLGFLYLRTVYEIDRVLLKKYLRQYGRLINKHKTFLEVYDKNGRPFRTMFYYSDEAMLWVANYLHLKRLLKP